MSTYRVNIMGERSMSTIRKFLKDESGATAIEYGLIAALVSVAIIAMLSLLGNSLNDTFRTVEDGLAGAADARSVSRLGSQVSAAPAADTFTKAQARLSRGQSGTSPSGGIDELSSPHVPSAPAVAERPRPAGG